MSIKKQITVLIIHTLSCCTCFCQLNKVDNVRPKTGDSITTINIPLPHEDFSLYDFLSVRVETDKTDIPPADIAKRNFQPVKDVFKIDSLHFGDSVQSVWFKFTVRNNYATDTSIALVFLQGIPKAILYKTEGDRLILIGKTGFFLAVIARVIAYDEYRIDLLLKAHSQTNYLLQLPRVGPQIFYMPTKTPALQSITKAEIRAFNKEKKVNRPNLLWNHFFTGIFFMFFVFGFIKFLVFGKDKAYLYYALLGLCSALLAIAQSEYPSLEVSWFEDLRGIELSDLLISVGFIMHGLFILEILQLKIKYPRITRAIKWYFLVKFLIAIINKAIWLVTHDWTFLGYLDTYDAFLFFLLLCGWVVYLATIRKGFYRFIFLGSLTIVTAYALMFILMFFNLLHLLPAWFGDDGRGSLYHFMSIALVIDMCFYFAGLAYRDRQKESQLADLKQKETELEMQALRAQMNPHFIFNSLNSINMFILENNKLQASEYLSKFSRLVRLILQNSQQALIPLETELEALQLYLQLESLRFDQKFKYKIIVADNVDAAMLKVPPLIIQPYAENAIWHGLMHKKEKGNLQIELYQVGEVLLCKITDDGIGRKHAAELKSKSTLAHKSMGMRITADRIAMTHQNDQSGNSIKVQDLVLADGSAGGTEVLLKFPAMS